MRLPAVPATVLQAVTQQAIKTVSWLMDARIYGWIRLPPTPGPYHRLMHDEAPEQPPCPPSKPLPSDCCESGCDRCVFDVYAEALANHERALAAWCMRNPEHTG